MTKKKSFWAVIVAFCLIVPAMFVMTACKKDKHSHTFSNEWTTNEEYHWHEATCKHTNEKESYEKHTVTTWTVKTEAGLHVDRVEQGTCTVCEKVVEKTIPNTAEHSYSTTWSNNETQHWKESTCEGHNPVLKSEVADHTGSWETKTPADYGVNKVEKFTCTICDFEDEREVENSALAPIENRITIDNEALSGFVFNNKSQKIDNHVSADNIAGIKITYKGTGGTTYTDAAPTNAGTYEYKITIPATAKYKEAQETGTFTIKKYEVNCPDIFESRLADGQTETNVLCEIDISDIECFESIGEIKLIHSENSFKVGRTVNILKDKIECNNPNFSVKKPSGDIDLVVLDTSDDFNLRITGQVTAGSCHTGTILHGSVRVNDQMKIVGTNSSGAILMYNITITKIEYLTNKYENDETKKVYKETSIATKNDIVKITFTKNDSGNMYSFDNIVSVNDIGTINQFQESKNDEAYFIEKEYRVFSATIETTDSIKLTISDSANCTVKVFNASTGAEITLNGANTFQVAEGTKIMILIKQGTSKGTHQVKLETLTLSV